MVAREDIDRQSVRLGFFELLNQRRMPMRLAAVDKIPGQDQECRPLPLHIAEQRVDKFQAEFKLCGTDAARPAVRIQMQVGGNRDPQARRGRRLRQNRNLRAGGMRAAREENGSAQEAEDRLQEDFASHITHLHVIPSGLSFIRRRFYAASPKV